MVGRKAGWVASGVIAGMLATAVTMLVVQVDAAPDTVLVEPAAEQVIPEVAVTAEASEPVVISDAVASVIEPAPPAPAPSAPARTVRGVKGNESASSGGTGESPNVEPAPAATTSGGSVPGRNGQRVDPPPPVEPGRGIGTPTP